MYILLFLWAFSLWFSPGFFPFCLYPLGVILPILNTAFPYSDANLPWSPKNCLHSPFPCSEQPLTHPYFHPLTLSFSGLLKSLRMVLSWPGTASARGCPCFSSPLTILLLSSALPWEPHVLPWVHLPLMVRWVTHLHVQPSQHVSRPRVSLWPCASVGPKPRLSSFSPDHLFFLLFPPYVTFNVFASWSTSAAFPPFFSYCQNSHPGMFLSAL